FHKELTRLRGSLAHFRYVVMVSTPDSVWNGNTGRLSELFLQEQVPDFGTPTFFLCGPKPFMQLAKDLLTKHGVTSDRIKQEGLTIEQKQGGFILPCVSKAADHISVDA